ncbi:MAG: hypothetical protein LQ344_006926 [Seirophora lacunosa]|nr:MAG: hypothetical protein LQ344_006926 [Seirophora lacunosa]
MSVSDANQQKIDSESRKRRRISVASSGNHDESDADVLEISSADWTSATRKKVASSKDCGRSTKPISPPPSRTAGKETKTSWKTSGSGSIEMLPDDAAPRDPCSRASPIQLSTVSGLPASSNIDTWSLGDILGDPLIKECWLFNYLFDEAAKRYANVQAITAYMAEMYGTHHSKMIILFRHDNQAQVIIITGNFIVRDWSMCQAVWRSPLLALIDHTVQSPTHSGTLPIGSGRRFKKDLLAYLQAYGSKRTGALTGQLEKYDFSSTRAALIASVPQKQNLRSTDPEAETLWGWPGLRHILSSIRSASAGTNPRIVMQCSSVASIGEKWMASLLKSLSVTAAPNGSQPKQTPKVSLVFPTASEIRRSVDGYASGGSIHMKTQTPAQQKQLTYLRPMLCHWAGEDQPSAPSSAEPDVGRVRQALRRRAAPHIKTYIRFADEGMNRIDWAMMTSANLSKQAWGEVATAGGEVRICSYEIGVVVWPDLWDEGAGVEMVPVFGKDIPNDEQEVDGRGHDEDETTDEEGGRGFREDSMKEPKTRKLKTRRDALVCVYAMRRTGLDGKNLARLR